MLATFYVINLLPDGRFQVRAYARRGTSARPNTFADVLAARVFNAHAEAELWRH